MNWKFVVRGLALALGALSVVLLVGYFMLPSLIPGVPYGPTPYPPAHDVPPGEAPAEWPGLEAWAIYEGADPILIGSAFLLRIPDGELVVAAAAHSFDLEGGLDRVHLSRAGPDDPLLVVDTLYGEPGKRRTAGMNLTHDYVFFWPKDVTAPDRILMADGRGVPQPGERVMLYPGVGEWKEPLTGTVLQADSSGAWIVMDVTFQPGLMSGAPVISQHTGKAVGMALAAGEREGQTIIGIHPIGSLVQKAEAARETIRLEEYRQ